jgi:MerR family copper efflux transcriptional regulator
MGYPMNIGEAAEAAGMTAKTIRHYEALGLIAAASRTDSGYRQYTADDVAVLGFIRRSRALGFSIPQIAELLELRADGGRRSEDVKSLASRHVADLDRKMGELARMKSELEKIAHDCHGDHRSDCAILRSLSERAIGPRTAESGRPSTRTRPARAPKMPGLAVAPGHAGLTAWMQGLGNAS